MQRTSHYTRQVAQAERLLQQQRILKFVEDEKQRYKHFL